MDHHYIDDQSVAERYLDHALPVSERSDFEAHLVDCQECTDRLLLAEMFHSRNGKTHSHVRPAVAAEEKPAERRRSVRLLFGFSWPFFWALTTVLAAGLVSLVVWAIGPGTAR